MIGVLGNIFKINSFLTVFQQWLFKPWTQNDSEELYLSLFNFQHDLQCDQAAMTCINHRPKYNLGKINVLWRSGNCCPCPHPFCWLAWLLCFWWSGLQLRNMFCTEQTQNRFKKKKGGNQFVWAYRGILYTLIMAKEIGQKSTAKSTQFPVKEFPNALTHNHPCGIHSFFSKIYNLLLSCDMLMVLLVVHVNGETHLLYWHIVPANICH